MTREPGTGGWFGIHFRRVGGTTGRVTGADRKGCPLVLVVWMLSVGTAMATIALLADKLVPH